MQQFKARTVITSERRYFALPLDFGVFYYVSKGHCFRINYEYEEIGGLNFIAEEE
jgi:hypothetical protein